MENMMGAGARRASQEIITKDNAMVASTPCVLPGADAPAPPTRSDNLNSRRMNLTMRPTSAPWSADDLDETLSKRDEINPAC